MLTWALVLLVKSAIANDHAVSGLGPLLVLSMVADVAIVGLVASAFWG